MNARGRIEARRSILTCTRCPLHSQCTRPVPWFGPAPNTTLVIGEAPGANEDKAGRPFIGRAGKLLRQVMGQVGIDPDVLTWANSVSCYPKRTPTTDEVAACYPNLLSTLAAVSPSDLLLIGGVALSAWRPDLRISQVHGRLFTIAPYNLTPTFHPAAALRDPNLVPVIRRDLERWWAADEGLISEACVKCGMPVDRYDPDGFPWCERHVREGIRGWARSRTVRATRSHPATQLSLV